MGNTGALRGANAQARKTRQRERVGLLIPPGADVRPLFAMDKPASGYPAH
jgi:hypothetical protein